jgi:hypothetical protein
MGCRLVAGRRLDWCIVTRCQDGELYNRPWTRENALGERDSPYNPGNDSDPAEHISHQRTYVVGRRSILPAACSPTNMQPC